MSEAYVIEIRNCTAGLETGGERVVRFFSSTRAARALQNARGATAGTGGIAVL